ncbi:MAG: LysE family translocator [Deltaproteobacteria bacterium]|nr:LysE family translocator [Deltaproteobacteria bacterium]
MSLSFILLFSLTMFVASIIPGPSMLLALTHGMQFGAKKTVASAMGNLTVTFIQASISIAGLGTILIASETVFMVIRLAGAAYLVFVGIGLIYSSKKSLMPGNFNESLKSVSFKKLYMQGALVTAGNPKAIVFFTAVFPQFIDVKIGFLSQSSILLSLGSVIAFSCYMIYAIGGQKIFSLFSTADAAKYIKRTIGGTFIGAGIGLAVMD